jgi:hypothetical protein
VPSVIGARAPVDYLEVIDNARQGGDHALVKQMAPERRGLFAESLMRLVLRVFLALVGGLMAAASRIDPVLRSCITRDVVFEISTEGGVARHWRFDGSSRRVSSHRGRAADPDCAMRFANADVAVRSLLARDPSAADKAIETRALRIEGSPSLALWFSGLAKRLTMIGRWRVRRRRLPHPYVQHDPSSRMARFITVEAPQRELDPSWAAAWKQRAKLAVVRVPAGERPQPF